MRKLLTILTIMLMVFSLFGCHSKKDDLVVTEEPVLEQTKEIEKPENEDHSSKNIPEEKEEIVLEEENIIETQDLVKYSYWVITYDQFNNVIDRIAYPYGSVIKGPDGKEVVVKGNVYFHTTVDYPTPKKESSNSKAVNYLFFKNNGTESGTIYFDTDGEYECYKDLSFWYSKDKESWTDVPDGEIEILPNETIYLKGNNDYVFIDDASKYGGVNISSNDAENENIKLELGGSIMTLMDPTDELRNISSIPGCFEYMFSGIKNLRNANDLVLPATKLSKSCYEGMFYNCINLESVSIDLLPARNLTGADNCYEDMFRDCEELTNVPNLPAKKLSDSCYMSMFRGCEKIETVPLELLPATDLTGGDSCYAYMFFGCKELICVPRLPSTKLSEFCYYEMFENCINIETVPVDLLPATNLSDCAYCYHAMFCNCDALSNVPELPAETLSEQCYESMFKGCENLESVPLDLLPATNLTGCDQCYYFMFANCDNLSNAPNLPAMNLSESCYYGMFKNCLNLLTAPVLSANVLTISCYRDMFNGCSSLNYVEVGFSNFNDLPTYATKDWLYSVASVGTFKWSGPTSGIDASESTIPSGWTIIN